MHLPAKANSLTVQTFMANKSLSDSDSDSGGLGVWEALCDIACKKGYMNKMKFDLEGESVTTWSDP